MTPYHHIPVMPIAPRLAEAYVPYQYYTHTYPIFEALDKGTLFPELYRPYVEKGRVDKHDA